MNLNEFGFCIVGAKVIIALLAATRPLSAAQVADATDCDPAEVFQVIQILRAQGIVEGHTPAHHKLCQTYLLVGWRESIAITLEDALTGFVEKARNDKWSDDAILEVIDRLTESALS